MVQKVNISSGKWLNPWQLKKERKRTLGPFAEPDRNDEEGSPTARPRGLRCMARWSNDMALGVGVWTSRVAVVRS
ncbi:hypothetical protein PVK06_041341 [Gossypium arboreum]|uniref:Uncharacterized protein n=1 Tax=Gossypium arboreum TaxID=29729 RepID=A0ABR0N7X4_GOSAR|nr:hypothetical protein PVK06_041341 [Gossypium arboreum]